MITPTMTTEQIQNALVGLTDPGQGIKSQVGVIIHRSLYKPGLRIEDRKGNRDITLEDAIEAIAKARLHWTHYRKPMPKAKPQRTSAAQRTPICCGQPMTQTVQGWVCDECDSVR